MKRSDLLLLLGAVAAVAVPAVILDLAAGADRRAAGLSAAPFAWRGALLAHLAAALPLGMVVAGRARAVPRIAAAPRWRWALLGVVVTGLAALLSRRIGAAVGQAEFGPVPPLLLRSLLAFILVLPWCVAAASPPAEARGPVPAAVAIGVGLGLAVVPCGLYAEAVGAALTREAAALLAQRRLVKAEGVVLGLCELGSERRINLWSPTEVRKRLAAMIPGLQREAARPLPEPAAPSARLDRAVLLIQLERLDEAAALLRPLVPGDETATLMLAALYRNQRRWEESDALYTAALERALPTARTDAEARARCRAAFEGLAENAREARRPAEAEAALKRGLQELPADAARFHFLLGRHYHDAGRVGPALDHLHTAARLDPAGQSGPAEELIRQVRTATPGCLAGLPR
jgi:hypothetical protein